MFLDYLKITFINFKLILNFFNKNMFEVVYDSLIDEVRIGDYYLRFLLTEDIEEATPIHKP